MKNRGAVEFSFQMVITIILIIATLLLGIYALSYFINLSDIIKNVNSPPLTPPNFSAENLSYHEIELSWQKAKNARYYLIERSISKIGPFIEIANLNTFKRKFKDNNLDPNTIYYYRIYAQNSIGKSNYSIALMTKTLEAPPGYVDPHHGDTRASGGSGIVPIGSGATLGSGIVPTGSGTTPVSSPSRPNPSPTSQASPGTSQSIPNPDDLTFSNPLTISSSKTLKGNCNYRSLTNGKAAITIKTNQPVVIEDCNLISKGPIIYIETSGANVIVRNTFAWGLNPSKRNEPAGRFLEAENPKSLTIEHNYMESTRGISVLGPNSGASIKINYNKVKNIDGRLSDGSNGYLSQDSSLDNSQFVQLDKVKGNIEIGWNEVINEIGKSRAEDVISLFQSGGTSSNWLDVHDNYIQGAYPLNPPNDDYSGGGILADSDNCEYITIEGNTVVSSAHYGIGALCGKHIRLKNNRAVSLGRVGTRKISTSNSVGMQIYQNKEGDDPCDGFSDVYGQGNVVGWYNSYTNSRNDVFAKPETLAKQTTLLSKIDESAEFARFQKKLRDNKIIIGPLAD